MDAKKIFTFGLAIISIIAGLLLNIFNIGSKPYIGFASVGTWLMMVGFVILIVGILPYIRKKEKLVDERMMSAGLKSMRVVFLFVLFVAFVTIVIDGITPISIPVGMFMAYLVNSMMVVYVISYWIITKYIE